MGNDDKTYQSPHSSFTGHLSLDYHVDHGTLLLAGELNPSGSVPKHDPRMGHIMWGDPLVFTIHLCKLPKGLFYSAALSNKPRVTFV